MTPLGETETIRCLLCRGVVCYSADDDSRYKDHLNVEHRVFYYVSWIIDKTVEENCKEEIDAQSLSLPNLTITPIHKTKPQPTNGCLPSTSSATSTPFIKYENGEGGSVEDDEVPVLSVFPISQLTHQDIAAKDDDIAIAFEDEAKTAKAELQELADDSMGYMEAKIIPIRVEGQRQGGRKMYKCSLCPNVKPWPTVHKAERHRITHIPLAFRKMFQCPQCKERFIKEKNVKRHLDSGLCQGPKEHPCTVCGEVFQSKFDLQIHEESHEQLLKRHRCRLCGAKFNKVKYLNKHIMSHSNRKPYKCDICGKAFKSEYYVKTHRNAHFSDGVAMFPPNAVIGAMTDDMVIGEGSENGYDEDEIDIEDHLAPEIDLIEEEPDEGGMAFGMVDGDDESGGADDGKEDLGRPNAAVLA